MVLRNGEETKLQPWSNIQNWGKVYRRMLNKEKQNEWKMQTWLYKEREGKNEVNPNISRSIKQMKGHEVSHDKEMKDKVYLSKQISVWRLKRVCKWTTETT